jgi:hypothetical protein
MLVSKGTRRYSMATLPKMDVDQPVEQLSREAAVDGLYDVIEGFFDDCGLTESQRDERYNRLREHLKVTDVATART